jgi:hypothetical protein
MFEWMDTRLIELQREIQSEVCIGEASTFMIRLDRVIAKARVDILTILSDRTALPIDSLEL